MYFSVHNSLITWRRHQIILGFGRERALQNWTFACDGFVNPQGNNSWTQDQSLCLEQWVMTTGMPPLLYVLFQYWEEVELAPLGAVSQLMTTVLNSSDLIPNIYKPIISLFEKDNRIGFWELTLSWELLLSWWRQANIPRKNNKKYLCDDWNKSSARI